MRVLFLYPNLYTQMGFNHGLASLSAVLKERGHETRLVNLNEKLPPVPTPEDVLALLRDWRPGLIGVSCLTMQYQAGLDLVRWLRREAALAGVPVPPVVVGGVHPTMVPGEVMADGAWDHVGVGECETSLVALVERLERGDSPDDVPNFLSWRGGRRPAAAATAPVASEHWVHNPVGEFPDVAALPMPDYELFDTGRITAQKQGWFGLMTSRGCFYRCTYCLNHKVVDRYRDELARPVSRINFFRTRPADKMIAEIRWVLERYPSIGTFILDDDLFTQDPEHAIAFAEAYERAGIEVPFVVNSHVKRLDSRVPRALVRAGCRILKVGIESGSPRVRRDVLKRFMTDEDILDTVGQAEGERLHTSGFVMVGLPTETPEELWETVDLLAKSGIGRFRTSHFFPFPGTESYDLALKAGHIRPGQEIGLTDFTESSPLDFGDDQNLLVEKLATCMPWFVNARLERHRAAPASRRWKPHAENVLSLSRADWEAFKPGVRELDRELSQAATPAGEEHYAIRYNAFMGVRSDYFLCEDSGIEWSTAAARPVPERLRELALAAAASEAC